MFSSSGPTTSANASGRLFLRFFILYLSAFIIGIFAAMRGIRPAAALQIRIVEFLFVPLAAFAAFLTIAKPYLSILTALKAIYDALLVFGFTRSVKAGSIGIFQWNAAFCLILFSLLLFCDASASACLFSFENKNRDMQLVFSLPFVRYLLRMLIVSAFACSLYYIWPRLLSTMT